MEVIKVMTAAYKGGRRGGVLKMQQGDESSGTAMKISALTNKDKSDVRDALEGGADYIALSFVRSPKDILDLKNYLKKLGAEDKPIIAKIEKPEALENIGKIIELSDGIMVARGDLGVELPANKVPIIQNKLIEFANQANKPVIVATQMLESMINNSRPTRAEGTDVAGVYGRGGCCDVVRRDCCGQISGRICKDDGFDSQGERGLSVPYTRRQIHKGGN